MSNRDGSEADPLGLLADEFVERYRKGERPDLSEYTARHPEMADEIREMFPLLVMMEKAGTGISSPSASSAPPSRKIAQEEPVPDVIAGYKIQREIGRGGMGIVYEAEQIALRRHVALKVLPGHALQRNLGLERFQQEARVAACLHHTNIVPVYEVGEDNNTFFYSMQYIHGQSLDQVLRELRMAREEGDQATVGQQGSTQVSDPEPLSDVSVSLLHGFHPPGSPAASPASQEEPPSAPLLPGQTSRAYGRAERGAYHRSVARVGIQVAEALGYAHQNGILHRDIKPANLLLDVHSRVWITDFGLAKARDTELTSEGDVVGTMRYMGPERFRGECQAQSDLFSLGATLYEMLLLRPAFGALSHLALMHQITHEDPLPLRHVDPTIPRDLETIVQKCLEKAPRRRYRSAGDVAEDLKRFLEYQPIRARRITLAEHFWRWCRRNPLIASLCLAVILVAALGFTGVLLQWRKAEKRRIDTKKAKDHLQVVHEELQRVTYNAKMNLAGEAWEKGGVDRARELLSWCLLTEETKKLRGFEWYYFHSLSQIRRLALTNHDHKVISAAYSPDGKQIASADLMGTVLISSSETGEVQSSYSARCSCLQYHPILRQLAIAMTDRTITILDTVTQKPIQKLTGSPGIARGMKYSPDGRYLAAVSNGVPGGDRLTVWEVKSKKQLFSIPGCTAGYGAMAYSPNGRHIAIVKKNRTIQKVDAMTGAVVKELTPVRRAIFGIDISPDGQMIALGTSDNQVELQDFDTGKPLSIMNDPRGPVQSVAFSPNGKRIAGGATSVFIWDVKTGSLLARMKKERNAIYTLAFSPDGKSILSCANEPVIKIHDSHRSTAPFTIPTQRSSPKSMTATSDAQLIATCSGRDIMLWDAQSGSKVHQLQKPEQQPSVIRISADGRLLASGGRDKFIHLWNLKTRKLVACIPVPSVIHALAFSPKSDLLAVALENQEVLIGSCQKPEWKPVQKIKAHTQKINAITFDSSGAILATSSDDGTARIWNVESGKEVAALVRHERPVKDIAFHPNGSRVATASQDRLINIWSAPQGEWKATLRGHTQGVNHVAYSPSGNRLVSAANDGSIKMWDVKLNEQVLTLHSEDHTSVVDLAFNEEETTLVAFWQNGLIQQYRAPRLLDP